MKKLLLVCILLLNACNGVFVYDLHRHSDWTKLSTKEKFAIIENGDARPNLFDGDSNIIYVGVRTPFDSRKEGSSGRLLYGELSKVKFIASDKCKSFFNLNNSKHVNSRVMTKDETDRLKLWFKTYYVFKCSKSSDQIASESNKAPISSLGKTNTLIRSFKCSYQNGYSTIRINGSSAEEITSLGITINYSNVTISDKGAFSLTGASNDPGRSWFIGAKSVLLLDIQMNPANCK